MVSNYGQARNQVVAASIGCRCARLRAANRDCDPAESDISERHFAAEIKGVLHAGEVGCLVNGDISEGQSCGSEGEAWQQWSQRIISWYQLRQSVGPITVSLREC